MQAVEFASKNGDFAGERQFADTGTQYEIASFRCKIDGADASLGDEQRDLQKVITLTASWSSSRARSMVR